MHLQYSPDAWYTWLARCLHSLYDGSCQLSAWWSRTMWEMDPTRPCPSRTVWLTEVRRPSHSRWRHSLGWDPTLYIRGKAEFVTLFFLTVDPLWPTPSTSSLWRTGTSVSFLPGGYFPRVCYQQKSQSRMQKNVSGEGGESISVILISHKLSLRLTFSFY